MLPPRESGACPYVRPRSSGSPTRGSRGTHSFSTLARMPRQECSGEARSGGGLLAWMENHDGNFRREDHQDEPGGEKRAAVGEKPRAQLARGVLIERFGFGGAG